ncbi:single-stranded DNA-binding protein [Clostridium cadaveris]|uniref:single-stranded DNA-binding protein n=1 Tax=Clostridium cadaveris TaxID=1529 RepID=UPI000409AD5A|nr:single-stranded DNA-binding protein [Clostridium cadaveris]
MNKVVLIGRFTKDPDLKYTPGNGTVVTTITLAVDKYNPQTKNNEADFINVVIWGKQAENTANYMSKGSQMAISGRIQTRSYDDKEGKKRYITEVVAQEVSFLSKGVGTQSNGNNQDFGQGFDKDIEPINGDDIPF